MVYQKGNMDDYELTPEQEAIAKAAAAMARNCTKRFHQRKNEEKPMCKLGDARIKTTLTFIKEFKNPAAVVRACQGLESSAPFSVRVGRMVAAEMRPDLDDGLLVYALRRMISDIVDRELVPVEQIDLIQRLKYAAKAAGIMEEA